MAPAAYSDLSKASNDLINKDFYHLSTAAVDVKTVAQMVLLLLLKVKPLKMTPLVLLLMPNTWTKLLV